MKAIKKEFESIFLDWIHDEQKYYLENVTSIMQNEKYKNCVYHKKLVNDLIEPYQIPSFKLADGYHYTSLRRLEDFFLKN